MNLEFFKAKRRPNYLILFVLALFYLIFFTADFSHSASIRMSGWAGLLYNLHVLNTLLTPVVLAVFASRIIDVEHRGHTAKLLETLVSRKRLFVWKLCYGTLGIFFFVFLEIMSLAVLTRIFLCPAFPYPSMIALSFFNLFACCLTVFLLHAALALAFPNQAITVIVGLLGALLGFLFLFLSTRTLYLTNPWSLFGALSPVQMLLDPETRQVSYVLTPNLWQAEIALVFWLLMMGLLCFFLIGRMDEGEFSVRYGLRKRGGVKTSYFSRMPVELLKLRRAPVWLAFFFVPVIPTILSTLNYLGNREILTSGWYSLWTQHTLFLAFFFLSALLALLISFSWRIEHTGTNWNTLLITVTPMRLVMSKFAISAFFSVLCVGWVGVLFLAAGLLVGLPFPPPVALLDWLLFGFLGSLSVCAVQTLLSILFHSFVLPIGIALLGGMVGLVATAKGMGYALPYSLLSLGLRANNPNLALNRPLFLVLTLSWVVGCFLLSVLYLRKTDVRTH